MALTVVAGSVARGAVPEAPVRVAPGPVHPLAPLTLALVSDQRHLVGVELVDPEGRRHESALTSLTPEQPETLLRLPMPARGPGVGPYEVRLLWRGPNDGAARSSHLGGFELRPYQFC